VSIDRRAFKTKAYAELATKMGLIVGPEAKKLEPLGIVTVGDMMLHVPRRYFSGTELSDLKKLRAGEEVAVLARVEEVKVHFAAQTKQPRLEATICDEVGGSLRLTFFGKKFLISYWEKALQPGRRGIFAGKVGEFHNRPQLSHPNFIVFDDENRIVGGAEKNHVLAEVSRGDLIGLYPATSKFATWNIAHCAKMALDHLAGMEDPLPGWIRLRAGLVELYTAFTDVHRPKDQPSTDLGLHRLLFDEVFSLQLTMARRRADAATHQAVPRPRREGGLLTAFDQRLPFTLTAGQQVVGDELFDDLAQPHPMQRLLQGEVGSGKTLVALRLMLAVVDTGGQTALLAPTEVLATQHYQTITRMLGELGHGGTLTAAEHSTEVTLLTGSMSAARKRAAMAKIASGGAGIVIGTHALLSDVVSFADLGLIVVDEQHRFGVEQRAALVAKASSRPHLLAMTATPIPRSVAMTYFGDLETATLTEIPAGRADVSTVVVDEATHASWVDRAWQRIAEEVSGGRQAFVVCSRIDPQDTSPEAVQASAEDESLPPARGVTELYEQLRTGPLSHLRIGMLHGQMSSDDKEAAMAAFAGGEVDVLVATTVIEVGVDVPNASVMVINDADRFGISQLHQLRGRIGRGEHPGVCLLLSHAAVGSAARQRLDAVAGTRDGFELAKVDLEQRQEGDILGASQSGARSSLRFLKVLKHQDLIGTAHDLAGECLAKDPDLTTPGLADMVTLVELQAAGEWLERS